ncbi:MAG: protein kinase domain-containing protein [Spirulinaceae cyanobacterium]
MPAMPDRYEFIRNLEQPVSHNGRSTLAKDTITDHLVVIKTFHCTDERQRENWLGQYQALLQRLQAIKSTQIVKYLHTQKNQDGFYLVRDYIPHPALDQLPNASYPEIQRIASKVLHTLTHLRRRDQGYIHANLKPSNVFIDDQGTTQLTDFGLLSRDLPASPIQDLKDLALTLISLFQPQPFTQLQAAAATGIAPELTQHPLIPPGFSEWLHHLLNLNGQDTSYSLAQAQSDLQGLVVATPIASKTQRRRRWPGRQLLSGLRRQLPLALPSTPTWLRPMPNPNNKDWLLMPVGEPEWTEADFQDLLTELGEAGYGWLDPEEVRRRLELLKQQQRLL